MPGEEVLPDTSFLPGDLQLLANDSEAAIVNKEKEDIFLSIVGIVSLSFFLFIYLAYFKSLEKSITNILEALAVQEYGTKEK